MKLFLAEGCQRVRIAARQKQGRDEGSYELRSTIYEGQR
ncbi:hypothetical protein A33Q_0127 [Indibacter alkaliphilus LW1]|uniref:Uncharacterized protein n=1 Tax=Indibacter alkaliphilus (strain CCUG 57479 / KCTC 22604 / LW1) TaxID=1189612 RepID=S2DSJ2_INDAL|nr:hypothetical protein A33Q_0127 [Indibacter alkaliphilus LW1]